MNHSKINIFFNSNIKILIPLIFVPLHLHMVDNELKSKAWTNWLQRIIETELNFNCEMYSSYMCLYCQIYRETHEGGILTTKTS